MWHCLVEAGLGGGIGVEESFGGDVALFERQVWVGCSQA